MTKDMLARAVRKFKRGDKSAFDYIYDNTYKVVYLVVFSILRSKERAEDVTQDAYIKAVQHLDEYEDDTHFVAWLTTIAKRLAINAYNRSKRDVLTDFADDGHQYGQCNMPDEDSFGLLGTARQLLDDTDYQILIMYAVAGYNRREIGKILDMPTSTVSHRYTKSIKKLKQYLNGGQNEQA